MQHIHQDISNKTTRYSVDIHPGLEMTNLTRIMNISKNSSLFNFTDDGLLMPENFNVQEEEEGGKFLSKGSLQKRYVAFILKASLIPK